jgi:large subunit ribosomal protein L18
MIQQYLNPRAKRHARLRHRIAGTAERPRLSIFRSNKSVTCQLIDDTAGRTLAAVSGSHLKLTTKMTKTERAIEVARKLAEQAKQHNISTLVFDRGGYKYHGRVKAVAEELRQKGLTF